MTPSALKYQYQKHNPDGHFFDYKTLRFFNDTMKNYGVADAGEYWELFRRKPVKYGLHTSSFFKKDNFEYFKKINTL